MTTRKTNRDAAIDRAAEARRKAAKSERQNGDERDFNHNNHKARVREIRRNRKAMRETFGVGWPD